MSNILSNKKIRVKISKDRGNLDEFYIHLKGFWKWNGCSSYFVIEDELKQKTPKRLSDHLRSINSLIQSVGFTYQILPNCLESYVIVLSQNLESHSNLVVNDKEKEIIINALKKLKEKYSLIHYQHLLQQFALSFQH